MPQPRARRNARALPPRRGARYQQAMRQIDRPVLLILAAVLAFGLLAAAMVMWGLR